MQMFPWLSSAASSKLNLVSSGSQPRHAAALLSRGDPGCPARFWFNVGLNCGWLQVWSGLMAAVMMWDSVSRNYRGQWRGTRQTKTKDESGRCPRDSANDNRKSQLSFRSFVSNHNKSFHHIQARWQAVICIRLRRPCATKMPGCEI